MGQGNEFEQQLAPHGLQSLLSLLSRKARHIHWWRLSVRERRRQPGQSALI